ncbi:hypothetical protein EC973_005686 [Apophysomyces ossiformis]|uniref:Uncharacterized protein n=1 Tax=Apophysomyces ossiformis TaxID=679940 RepID=A0A8H7BWW6_9FUNG|nr:hypothetical protein EC973_005686 [Apophysomyces ossiformis]
MLLVIDDLKDDLRPGRLRWQRFQEPDRKNSYLPYSHHPPNPAEARKELYLEEDAVSTLKVDVIGIHDESRATTMTMTFNNNNNNARPPLPSLTDLHKIQGRTDKSSIHRRVLIQLCILLLVVISLVIFFCWPRCPHLLLTSHATAILPVEWGPDTAHPSMNALWLINATLDNRQNWIPTHIAQIDLTLTDNVTHQAFGWATQNQLLLQPRTTSDIQMMVQVHYDATSQQDPTFQHLYQACGPLNIATPSALNVTAEVITENKKKGRNAEIVVFTSQSKLGNFSYFRHCLETLSYRQATRRDPYVSIGLTNRP